MLIVLLIILVYLIGSILFGLIVGKFVKGIDIWEYGSGNLGVINVFCMLGVKVGLIVIVGDILKGMLVIVLFFFMYVDIYLFLVGVFVVLGYVFFVFVKFKGGKVVVMFGGVLLFYVFLLFIMMVVVFFIFLYLIKFVFLLLMLIGIYIVIYSFFVYDKYLLIVVILFIIFVIYRYWVNIK